MQQARVVNAGCIQSAHLSQIRITNPYVWLLLDLSHLFPVVDVAAVCENPNIQLMTKTSKSHQIHVPRMPGVKCGIKFCFVWNDPTSDETGEISPTIPDVDSPAILNLCAFKLAMFDMASICLHHYRVPCVCVPDGRVENVGVYAAPFVVVRECQHKLLPTSVLLLCNTFTINSFSYIP
jgi:hypothetical protein